MLKKILRPGEIKILKAVQESNERFNDLSSQTNKKTGILQPNCLSEYLINLQKKGLVLRDIDSRKYGITKRGLKALEIQKEIDIVKKKLGDFLNESSS